MHSRGGNECVLHEISEKMQYKELIDYPATYVRKHFLKWESYCNVDLPKSFNFEHVLKNVLTLLGDKPFEGFCKEKPREHSNVNYRFLTNKDGRHAWRPFELIHPLIYVELVRTITCEENWNTIVKRFQEFKNCLVECYSVPVTSVGNQSDRASLVSRWWEEIEQRSISLALQFDHVLQTDVTDCYGTLYTHSISWSLHGKDFSKKNKNNKKLLGNEIDFLIGCGRYGQTNGIAQGSELMDFIAELVLGYIDMEITKEIKDHQIKNISILRFRDDYRIFTNSDHDADKILRIISEQLHFVGLKLNTSKTFATTEVVINSLKSDKIAGLELPPFDQASKLSFQKQLTVLCLFGKKHPNSGELRKSLSRLHEKFVEDKIKSQNVIPEIAIVVDIVLQSPRTLPAAVGILSKLFAQEFDGKADVWASVVNKLRTLPYNTLIEIWLQRLALPRKSTLKFESEEKLCKVAGKESVELWNNNWISNKKLKECLESKNLLDSDPCELPDIIHTTEIELFKRRQY